MYSAEALARRKCRATRQDGQPCRAYALWDDGEQRCMSHAGRHHSGPMPVYDYWWQRPARRSRTPSCRCRAYPWPHRPGGGDCSWPDV
jgi:hypothetical protein